MRVVKIENGNAHVNGLRVVVRGSRGIMIPREAEITEAWDGNGPEPDGRFGKRYPNIEMDGAVYKYCPVCRQWVNIVYFARDKAMYDGRRYRCSHCVNKKYAEKKTHKFI